MDISLLIPRIVNSDEQAFRQFFHLYSDRLFRFANTILQVPQEAEEVVSDVFLNIWQRRENLGAVKNINTYLYSAIRNTASSQNIIGGFHSLTASSTNWVGIYELNTGNSIGYYQYLSNSTAGSFTIPASVVQTLTQNKLYILRFYNGAGGIGQTFLGTSHPFYKI